MCFRPSYPEAYLDAKSGWSSQTDYYGQYYSGQYDYGGNGAAPGCACWLGHCHGAAQQNTLLVFCRSRRSGGCLVLCWAYGLSLRGYVLVLWICSPVGTFLRFSSRAQWPVVRVLMSTCDGLCVSWLK